MISSGEESDKLDQLVIEVKLEESQTMNEGADNEEEDDLDGWVDEVEALSDEEGKEP